MTTELTLVASSGSANASFPFGLEDLAFFIIERENGDIVKFNIDSKPDSYSKTGTSVPWTGPAKQSVSAYCNHDPAKLPTFEVPGKVQLYIADSLGTKNHKKEFDLVIDGGDVLTVYAPPKPRVILEGDQELADLLSEYVELPEMAADDNPRVLQIDWYDRKAPDLSPAFWPALAAELVANQDIEKVLVCCQGGHGRSGSSMVALMMCYTDYDALDAITHLRAIHCPRAIESQLQHDYLNRLAAHLGRAQNAHDSYKVNDFRARFLTLTSPFAKPYQDRLKEITNG